MKEQKTSKPKIQRGTLWKNQDEEEMKKSLARCFTISIRSKDKSHRELLKSTLNAENSNENVEIQLFEFSSEWRPLGLFFEFTILSALKKRHKVLEEDLFLFTRECLFFFFLFPSSSTFTLFPPLFPSPRSIKPQQQWKSLIFLRFSSAEEQRPTLRFVNKLRNRLILCSRLTFLLLLPL